PSPSSGGAVRVWQSTRRDTRVVVDLSRPETAGHAGGIDWPTLAKDPRFTESRDDLRQLYELAQYGQLNDEYMGDLSDDQLIFLAAHDPAVASLESDLEIERASLKDVSPGLPYKRQKAKVDDLAAIKNKLEQNARRARLDLDRRRERVTRRWTAA